MQKTKIEWTDTTWNPIRGCSRVSEGCRNCYAETIANRFKGEGQPYEGLIAKSGQWNGQIKLLPEKLLEPWRMVKPRRIFVNSTSDLFHEHVPFEFIAAVFWIMSVTTRHTYQVLTKRPQRMLEFFTWANDSWPWFDASSTWAICDKIYDAAHEIPEIARLPWESLTKRRGGYDNCGPAFPYKNVWLGVSVEDQQAADERIPLLLKTPAAVRFISAEPLLSQLDLKHWMEGWMCRRCGVARIPMGEHGYCDCPMPDDYPHTPQGDHRPGMLDWVIVGGESAPGTIGYKTPARPTHPDWIRSLRDQCIAASVPFFFKQWGNYKPHDQVPTPGKYNGVGCLVRSDGRLTNQADYWEGKAAGMNHVGKKAAGRILDGRTWDQYPETA